VVGCKAYDLAQTMTSFAPAVGPGTAILPLLNGMRHLEALGERFGAERVLGGLCMISASLDDDGTVLHHNDLHGLTFGEFNGARSTRVQGLEATFAGANFDARASGNILQDMWEKWMFIASAASMTCLMRGTVGDIVQSGGIDVADAMVDECAAILAHNGFAPRLESLARAHAMLKVKGSSMTASMFKDIERGAPVEADHIVGDLLRRGADGGERVTPLRIAYAHLLAYEARRAREASRG
jgi:2-dehydropantoate 2-reductase